MKETQESTGESIGGIDVPSADLTASLSASGTSPHLETAAEERATWITRDDDAGRLSRDLAVVIRDREAAARSDEREACAQIIRRHIIRIADETLWGKDVGAGARKSAVLGNLNAVLAAIQARAGSAGDEFEAWVKQVHPEGKVRP